MSTPVGVWVDAPCENRDAEPSRRQNSACAVYKDYLYVFGGIEESTPTDLNDFHEFNFSTKRWRAVPASGEVPRARHGHSCAVYKDTLYVFGGVCKDALSVFEDELKLNDLIEFSFVTQQWSTVVANSGSAPTPRALHAAVVYDKSMYCFGGKSRTDKSMYSCFYGTNRKVHVLNDFHEYNFETRTWSLVRATGAVPQARAGASIVVFENKGILFGGDSRSLCLNDLHLFHFGQRVWSSIAAQGPAPRPREGHTAVVYSNAMYVFGGYADTEMDDLHKLPLGRSESRQWQEMVCEGSPPPECCFTNAVVYDSSLIVFGGDRTSNKLFQFRLEDTKNTQTTPFLTYLRTLVNNEFTSDITFIVEGTPIYGHKYLCMRCNYFKVMLTSDMVESRSREIVISDVRRPIFLKFLEYLYTDTVEVAIEDTMELLVLADRYNEDQLKRICENHFLDSLCVENAATLFHAADQYHGAMLRERCVSFILANFDVVSKTPAFGEMSRMNVELNIELLNRR